MIVVVAVALVNRQGQVLMQRRHQAKAHGGLWEFPGGKVEPQESLKSAACREIFEELGIVIETHALEWVAQAAEEEGVNPQRSRHVIILYKCREWRGIPECRDATALAWVELAKIPKLDMPPLDYPLARALISSN